MSPESNQELLRLIPPITELLKSEAVSRWTAVHPAAVVTESLRNAVAEVRRRVLENSSVVPEQLTPEAMLARAAELIKRATTPRLRFAINATGIILHTGLGRAVLSGPVVNSVLPELQGCCTLAIDPETGERVERDELLEPILKELTGAEAATVVNNNAAATLLVLAALAAQREVLVSRGQLIEIGGSFRLPEVMLQSQARLVEVGATNRTHLKDYQAAITPQTAAIMRVHPSNYRVVGFTSEPDLTSLAELAHNRGLILIDDLGAGALLDLGQFGLPHEPTVRESIQAGADVVLFSGDKLIGGSQSGILVGRKRLIDRLRKHPLMRSVRVDKTCAMLLERTLHLFRDPELLRRDNPTYRMLCEPLAVLRQRAEDLVRTLSTSAPLIRASVADGVAYLGSGSLPTQAIPSVTVRIIVPSLNADELARRLRTGDVPVFGRIEEDHLLLDLRTVSEADLPKLCAALAQAASSNATPSPE